MSRVFFYFEHLINTEYLVLMRQMFVLSQVNFTIYKCRKFYAKYYKFWPNSA